MKWWTLLRLWVGVRSRNSLRRTEAASRLSVLDSPLAARILIDSIKRLDECDVEFMGQLLVDMSAEGISDLLVDAALASCPITRSCAAFAIGKRRDPGFAEALCDMLDDSNDEVRNSAVKALKQVGGTESARALLASACGCKLNAPQETLAYKLLIGFRSHAIPPLCEALKDSGVKERALAATALGEIGDVSVIDILFETFLDSPNRVQGASEKALFALGITDFADRLTEYVTDPRSNVRRLVIKSLGKHGDSQHISILATAIQDPDEMVSENAVKALARFPEPEAIESLRGAFSQKHKATRRSATEILSRLQCPDAYSILLEALNDSDEVVLRSAAKALMKSGDQSIHKKAVNAIRQVDAPRREQARQEKREQARNEWMLRKERIAEGRATRLSFLELQELRARVSEKARRPLSTNYEPLAYELCRLLQEFRSQPEGEKHHRGQRIVKIGEQLNIEGGFELMVLVCERVRVLGGDENLLDNAWNDIGNWGE